jgi:hypothetical protein
MAVIFFVMGFPLLLGLGSGCVDDVSAYMIFVNGQIRCNTSHIVQQENQWKLNFKRE